MRAQLLHALDNLKTILLEGGFDLPSNPKVVSEMLGHATIVITLDTYSHFLPSMGDQTVAAMESALS